MYGMMQFNIIIDTIIVREQNVKRQRLNLNIIVIKFLDKKKDVPILLFYILYYNIVIKCGCSGIIGI